MTRNADVNDFVARDEDGDSLAVEETIELDGDDVTVKFVPATRGFMNEIDAMDADEVENEAIPRVLKKYRTPDFRNDAGEVPDETVDSIPLPRLNKLFNAFLIGSGVEEEAIENPEEYVDDLPGNRQTA